MWGIVGSLVSIHCRCLEGTTSFPVIVYLCCDFHFVVALQSLECVSVVSQFNNVAFRASGVGDAFAG